MDCVCDCVTLTTNDSGGVSPISGDEFRRWPGPLCCKMFTEPPRQSGCVMMMTNDVVVTDWTGPGRQGASAVLSGRLSLFDNNLTYVDNTLLYTTNQNIKHPATKLIELQP